jgi:glutamine synthetase
MMQASLDGQGDLRAEMLSVMHDMELRVEKHHHEVAKSVWKGERPTFAGNLYADLSDTALYSIGGIIHHAKATTIGRLPLGEERAMVESKGALVARRRRCSPLLP